MRKRVATSSASSDGPQSQSMTRFSASLTSHSPTPRRSSPSSFTFTPSPTLPPSPLALQKPSKPLTIQPELATSTPTGFSPSSTAHSDYSTLTAKSASSASSSSVRALLSRLSAASKRDERQWVASTPTGADALRFRHFCPICYRHFASIYATSCCAHNICHECVNAYVQTRLPNYMPLSFIPTNTMPCACPTCNQQKGVRFLKVADTSSGRQYVESPRTAALVRQHEEHEAEAEGRSQLELEGERSQLGVMVVS